MSDPTNPRHDDEKMTPERLGEMIIKIATETAYAAAGIADSVAAKAKVLYEQQRKTLDDVTPDGVDPNFKKFVDQMPDQFKNLVDEATKAYHDLADRGRHVVENLAGQAAQAAKGEKAEKPEKGDHPGAFDLHEAADSAASGESEGEAATPEPVVGTADAPFQAEDVQSEESRSEN